MKDDFIIKSITKHEAEPILSQYHYLTHISRGFKSGYNYGCFYKDTLVGVVIYTGFPVPELMKSIFGLPRKQQQGFFELSRLCLTPDIQKQEHNLASWFVARTLKILRKETLVRCVLSYADSQYHTGTIYAALNFKYYGLTEQKCDYFIVQQDGTERKHSRGKMSHLPGVWRPRTRKHRFLLLCDTSLNILWKEQEWKRKGSDGVVSYL